MWGQGEDAQLPGNHTQAALLNICALWISGILSPIHNGMPIAMCMASSLQGLLFPYIFAALGSQHACLLLSIVRPLLPSLTLKRQSRGAKLCGAHVGYLRCRSAPSAGGGAGACGVSAVRHQPLHVIAHGAAAVAPLRGRSLRGEASGFCDQGIARVCEASPVASRICGSVWPPKPL